MRQIWKLSPIIAGLAILAIVSVFGIGETPAQESRRSLQVLGQSRNYRLYVPPSYSDKVPAPVVLVFHGGGGRARGIESLVQFQPIADREGIVVVYPNAKNRLWEDGRSVTRRDSVDDVAFVSTLLDRLSQEYALDPRQIYGTGISNGGFLTQLLACELGDRIAAVATVAATMPEAIASQCQPPQPVSVLSIAGTDDPFVPYEGGTVQSRRGGDILSVDASAELWARVNGCSPQPQTTMLPDRTDDGTQVEHKIYSNCQQGTAVEIYRIQGGGHTWPGGPQYLPKRIVGPVSRDLDASEAIWSFFQTHSRRSHSPQPPAAGSTQ